MVIQVILTLGLLLALLYAFVQQASTRLLRLLMAGVVGFGIYMVWFPSHTMVFARFLGVGRGADLIAYSWIVVSFLLILVLHLRTVRLKGALTELAREITLLRADSAGPQRSVD